MSSKQNKGRDPEKRTAKRRRQREAIARGAVAEATRDRPGGGQATHASSASATKKARHGERRIQQEHSE